MANAGVVAFTHENVDQQPISVTEQQNNTHPSQLPEQNPSIVSQVGATTVPLIRRLLKDKGISATASNIIEHSWRKSTAKQYAHYIKQWELFCR
jgi:hypothetical protein